MTLLELDISLLRLIHHHRLEFLDSALYYISAATTFVSVAVLLGILLQAWRTKSAALKTAFVQLLAVLLLCSLTTASIKHLLPRERPFVSYPDIQKLSQAGSSSFPSGHTTEVFSLAITLALLFPRWRLLAFAWALLIAYTRMALGVHYPLDVLAGIIIGLNLGYGVHQLIALRTTKAKELP